MARHFNTKVNPEKLSFKREDIIWLAGLLEGEGSFQIAKQPNGNTTRHEISISMTDKDIIKRASKIMGGNITQYDPNTHPSNKSRKCQLIYRVRNGRKLEVYAILSAIYSFMGLRRKNQIEKLMEDFCHS